MQISWGRLSNPLIRQWPHGRPPDSPAAAEEAVVEIPKVFGVPAIFHPSTAPATPRQGLGLTATPPTTIQNQQ